MGMTSPHFEVVCGSLCGLTLHPAVAHEFPFILFLLDRLNDGVRPAAQPTNRCADELTRQTELPDRFAPD